jgi:hypothetical protein
MEAPVRGQNRIPELDQLHALRRHVDIVHHIPGRVRLRLGLPLLGRLEQLDTGVFQRVLASLDGIRDVRVNAAALSVVVQYDPAQMPPTLWQILTEGEDAQVEALLTPWLSRFAAELP